MRNAHRDRARGFSLVELMVTLSVLGVILIAIFSTVFRTNDVSRHVSNVAEVRQSGRAAVQLIERDVRMAGSGWGRMPLNVSNGGTAEQWWAIQPGPGAGGNDSVRLIGAWDATTTLAANMLTPSSTMTVYSTTGFASGDLCVLTDGTSAHMFQVTGTGSGTLDHDTSSPWNNTAGFANWPAGGYPMNRTTVYKATLLTYRVDSTSFRRPTLVRLEYGRAPAAVMFDLDRFQMWYRIFGSPDSVTRSPSMSSGVSMIDKVQPRIYTRAVTRGHPAVLDSVWSEIQPRTL